MIRPQGEQDVFGEEDLPVGPGADRGVNAGSKRNGGILVSYLLGSLDFCAKAFGRLATLYCRACNLAEQWYFFFSYALMIACP